MKEKVEADRFQQAFRQWLVSNEGRFIHHPVIRRPVQGRMRLAFAGIAPQVSVDQTLECISVVAKLRRKIFDILADFEVSARWDKTAKAYYCELCTEGPGPRTFFPDRESLWADHCFEPLLEWVNTQLTDDAWIGYYRVGRGSTYVALGTPENLDILGDPSSQVALFKAVLDDQSAGATDNPANETSTAT